MNKFFCIILNKILQKTEIVFKTQTQSTQDIKENLKEYFFSDIINIFFFLKKKIYIL